MRVSVLVSISSVQLPSTLSVTPRATSVRSLTSGEELSSLANENLDAALELLLTDQLRTAPLNVYRVFLKACAEKKVLARTRKLQLHLTRLDLAFTRFLGEHLVSTLVKCGGLEEAVEVFNNLTHRGCLSWNAIVSGYAAAGQGKLAIKSYDRMIEEGLIPDKQTFVSLLGTCRVLADLEEGKRIHAEAVKYGCDSDLYVATRLVYMYGKCGSLVDALNVFHGLPQRNVVLWTVMLSAYAQQGQAGMALQLYVQMRGEGTSPDVRSCLTALQACGMLAERELVDVDVTHAKVKSLQWVKGIHADAQRKGYIPNNFLGNTLIATYGKCCSILDARVVFDELPFRDVVSWTAMLGAYVQHGQAEKALTMYEEMLKEGTSANDVTFVCVIQACGLLSEKENCAVNGQVMKHRCLQQGKEVHAELFRTRYMELVPIGNSLVSMYAKCGSIMDAQNVFDRISHRNVISWTSMLTAYAQQGEAEEALELYQQMKEEGLSPDHVTFVSLLQACGMLSDEEGSLIVDGQPLKVKSLSMGKVLHADACRKGYDLDVFVANTLINMYARCGSLADAWNVFRRLSCPDVVSWTVIVGAHAHQGHASNVFQLYRQMQNVGVSPNEVTLVCILQACSDMGGLDLCRQIHRTLISAKKISIPLVATTLIHAYARCASMDDARSVFESMQAPDVVAWTALIAGYAREGNFSGSLECYEHMLVAGVKPNAVTFLSLLSACSHAGLVYRGVEYFQSMSRDYGLIPEAEHYVCMVDLLGRAGHFNSIEGLLLSMPHQPNLSIWLSLLSACRKHGKLLLGRQAFDQAVQLEPKNAAAYNLMSNLYRHVGLWGNADRVKALERGSDVWRKPALSWIESDQEVYFFAVEDRKHTVQEATYRLLRKVTSALNQERWPNQSLGLN